MQTCRGCNGMESEQEQAAGPSSTAARATGETDEAVVQDSRRSTRATGSSVKARASGQWVNG